MGKDDRRPKPQIIPLPNGPYLLFDEFAPLPVKYLESSSGERYSTVRGVSLCRCGGSADKPLCDGSHHKLKFSDRRETDGSLDKRRDYVRDGVTIHDNRGICSHAGECTRGLPSVFKKDARPWIEPQGAEVEEIMETVKRCPSGALSYSVGGVEHRDQDRPPKITVVADGPYEIVGGVELIGVAWGEEASKEHYSLCRCGESKNKPFCDGSHRDAGFKDGG